jgi:hypothetical protein
VAQPTPQPRNSQADLLLKVWQDSEGFLLVEVEGQRYRRLFDIQDGNVGRNVLEIINRLVAFSKGNESRAADVSEPQGLTPTPSTVSPPPGGFRRESPAVTLNRQNQNAQRKPKPPRITVDPVPFRRKSAAKEIGITLNLADEIDQLVQTRLNAAPELAAHRIRVSNAPDGGLRFEVNGRYYGSLDDVPELQVQALIRAAIADWEMAR